MHTSDEYGTGGELEDPPAVIETRRYLRERFGDEHLSPDATPELDSMDWIELATRIGDRTGVRVDDHDLARVGTVRELLAVVARRDDAGASDPVAPLARPEDVLSPAQRSYLDPLSRWMALAARAMFALNRTIFRRLFHLRVTGLENLPDRGPFIIAPNHISYLDGLVVAAALPYSRLRRLRWVAYAGAALANPFTRLASRLAMMMPIDADEAPLAGLASGAAVLGRGDVLVWFPAGQRSPDGEVQDFQPGIGALADYYRPLIVPVVIDGTRRAMPPGSDLPRPRNVTLTFGPALDPTELARSGRGDDDRGRIVNGLHDRVAEMRRVVRTGARAGGGV